MAYEHSDEAESQQQTEELQSAEDQGTATPDATKQTSQTPTAKIPSVKTTSVQQSTRKRKRTLDEFELRMLKSVEAGDQEDRHMQFFKGILPSVQKFTDNQVVDFQMGVLQVIKNIQNTVSIPTTQPQQLQIYAPPCSQQHTHQYPCSSPLQNSQQYPSSDLSYTPLLGRVSSQHHETIPSSTISTNIISPGSNDTQSRSNYSNLTSPFSHNSDIDF
ncbi:unnamed protein product [Acanthoscelides obtectus]|uniref:BESS domain-containing protein n=1 Tax=Acanthoscelides obtectus TaxID=200917 RepID=A0A9P0K9Y3_ACAOB|nr:unnamed protein product [Acanthoscelides obtectus]CAK1632284.1 hypothetical protein AOBTE_LOCUS7463 [Acanthoscelides obtectus]